MHHLPRTYHVLILAALIAAVLLVDMWAPLGLAVWLLYVIPIGYAMRYVRKGRITVSMVTLVTGGLTVLILLGWYRSPTGLDRQAALLNRLFGIVALWFMAMFVAWLSIEFNPCAKPRRSYVGGWMKRNSASIKRLTPAAWPPWNGISARGASSGEAAMNL